jgi:5'-nucleotidase/UDP-sugar diphosphatase
MKKYFSIGTVLLFVVVSIQFLYSSETETVTILHTNDIHGSFVPIEIKDRNNNNQLRQLGGVLALQYQVQQIRKANKNVLLLDAGDFMTGNPICEMEFKGAIGGPMIKFFNYIGYEGMTPGNHEFDISVKNTKKLIELCQFPVFSANLFTSDGKLFTEEPYQIYSKGNLVIGVIGTIVEDLPDYLNKPQKDQVFARPAAAIIDSLAKILDPLTDLIIVLSHTGLESDNWLAQNLGHHVDVIIGGHSHDRLEQVVKINRKLIVQAGSKLRNLGRLDLTVAADTVKDFNYQLIPLWNDEIEPDTILMKEVQNYQQLIDRDYGRIIGELKTGWERSHYTESNLGNFIADCIRNFSGADFALINSGGIRQNQPEGPIKKLDIKNILPFSNSITKFTVTGSELMRLIHNNARSTTTRSNGILQVSGLRYEYQEIQDDSVVIVCAMVNSQPLNPDKIYHGATVDFVITNAEKYLGVVPAEVFDLMMPLSDVVMKTIEDQKIIDSRIEGRIVKKD